jgi:DNA-binding beta-propeller fold protein YncE
MAGHHQIWVMDLEKKRVASYAGDGGEDIVDGTLSRSRFAQPSGLATDGKTLYVADSETSSIRAVPMTGRGEVRTIVGRDLFKFGDVDGYGDEVRLQHALGVTYHDGKLYVADTYNSKIKALDPLKRECKTFLGGEAAGWLAGPLFSEPGGIHYAAGKLYVADTNAHRIRIIDLQTKTISTLRLQGVEAPKLPKS